METTNTMRRWKLTRVAIVILAIAFVAAACSGSDDAGTEAIASYEEPGAPGAASVVDEDGEDSFDAQSAETAERASASFTSAGVDPIDARVIRDGMVDLRIAPDTFESTATQVRAIAVDLGGYVSSGESTTETYGEERYAVGWFTIRIPSDRFDDAVVRIDALGENVSSSMSSQDVTEEYVDLDGRLNYWREQEAFYTRLMDEATTIKDLVAVQTQMQDVLLNIEQIEGRLRYLDSRTEYATLTIGLTEVPEDAYVSAGLTGDGPIAKAFDEAGEVLIASVAFLIVATAMFIPVGIFVLFAYAMVRLVLSLRRKKAVNG